MFRLGYGNPAKCQAVSYCQEPPSGLVVEPDDGGKGRRAGHTRRSSCGLAGIGGCRRGACNEADLLGGDEPIAAADRILRRAPHRDAPAAWASAPNPEIGCREPGAGIRAGYSAKTARQQGTRLFTNVAIQAALSERQKACSDHPHRCWPPERPADNADYRRGDGLRRHRSQAGRLALDHGGLGDRRLLAQG